MTKRTILSIVTLLSLTLLSHAVDAPAKKNLLKPTNVPENWRLEIRDGGKGVIAADGDAILFTVTDTDDTGWHVQANQFGLALKDDATYIVTFKAKSSADRSVQLNAMIDQDDWHPIGLTEAVDLTAEWKEYKYEFKAGQTVANKNRIGFVLGNEKGKVWIKDFALAEK